MDIKISNRVYSNCNSELYYMNRFEDIENGSITEFTLQDLDNFFANNITWKKVGKGEQVIYTVKNLTDAIILQHIFYDLEHYAKMHYEEYDWSSPPYSKSEHKKQLEIVRQKAKEISEFKRMLNNGN